MKEMIIRTLLVISILATVAPAAVKRDEFGGSSGSSNSNTPVYSPSSTGGSYSNSNSYGSNGYSRDSGNYANSNQFSSDHAAAASSNNYQSQPNSQGNLYYYYYPVQDKPKDSTYQASSSNQYSSAVTPNNGAQHSADSSGHSLDTAAAGQDLSYSAQDLSYSAQSLGQGLNQGLSQGISEYSSGQAGGYDQTLSSLASQLQQYGFGAGGAGGAFNPNSAAAYGASPSNYGSGSSYALGSDTSSSGYASNSNPASSYGTGSDGSSPYSAAGHPSYSASQNTYGSQGGQMSYGPQQGAYPGYGGQHYGNYAAGSSQHASYEPATSGYRRYGIGSILMPMLALAGLSLLIPTVTSLGAATGRKKRSIDSNNSSKDSALGTYLDRIERYYSIYKTAVEREECMNRIICELGDAVSNVRGKSTLFTIVEKVVPTWMGTKVGVFKSGALSSEYGKCKKYTCQ